jgi:hypothetical protein
MSEWNFFGSRVLGIYDDKTAFASRSSTNEFLPQGIFMLEFSMGI